MLRLYPGVSLALLLCTGGLTARGQSLDLTKARVFAPPSLNNAENHAVAMLIDEVAARTRIRLPLFHVPSSGGAPLIVIGTATELKNYPMKDLGEATALPEGYRIGVN